MLNIIKSYLKIAGIAIIAFSFPIQNAVAEYKSNSDKFLIAQRLGEIERKIDLSEVPMTVLSSATTVAGATPSYAQIQINPDGSLVYELGGQNEQGFDFEIEINPNGEIVEIDEQIQIIDIPENVMKVFKYWLPSAQIVTVWRSTRYKSFDYYYEITIDDDFWVEIPANGKSLKINPL